MKKKYFDLDLLQLGITDICNNKCIMCHQSADWFNKEDQGYMSFDDAKTIFDDIYEKEISFRVLHTFWKGEPFINPDFLKILEYIFNKNKEKTLFEKIYINTNGTLLKGKEEEFMRVLNIDPNIHSTVNFSLDSVSQETYKKIRGTEFYPNIESSLKKMIELREKTSFENPVFIFQLVIQKLNAGEMDLFVEKWTKELEKFGKEPEFTYYLKDFKKDVIFFRPLQPETEESRELWMRALKKYLPEEYKKLNEVHISRIHASEVKRPKIPCFHLWKTPIIEWDGSITACCGDFNLELMKDFKEKDGFLRSWYGPEMEKLRMSSYFCHYDKMPEICKNCFMYLELTEEFKSELEEWAIDRGLPVLYSSNPKYSTDVDELVNIANKRVRENNLEDVENIILRALQLSPLNEKALRGLAIYYRKSGKEELAIRYMKKLLKEYEKDKYKEELAYVYDDFNKDNNAFEIYKELYLNKKNTKYLINMIDLGIRKRERYFLEYTLKIIFEEKIKDKECLKNIIDIYYLAPDILEENMFKKTYVNLKELLVFSEKIDSDFFFKFFYLKRELGIKGIDKNLLRIIEKYEDIIKENNIIELLISEKGDVKNSLDNIILIVRRFIKEEISFAASILKEAMKPEDVYKVLVRLDISDKKKKQEYIKHFLKENDLKLSYMIYNLKSKIIPFK